MNIDDIKTVAVIGAGDMGHGIADLAKRLEGLAGKYNKEIFKPAKMVREGTYK